MRVMEALKRQVCNITIEHHPALGTTVSARLIGSGEQHLDLLPPARTKDFFATGATPEEAAAKVLEQAGLLKDVTVKYRLEFVRQGGGKTTHTDEVFEVPLTADSNDVARARYDERAAEMKVARDGNKFFYFEFPVRICRIDCEERITVVKTEEASLSTY